jgi:hypothetical protein
MGRRFDKKQGEGYMRFKFSLSVVLACLLLATGVAWAQGAGTSGGISGMVVDPTGFVVAKASVVAVDDAKGIQHHAQTDNGGRYHFGSLPPAIYTLTVKSTGFAPEVRKSIVVILGETTTVDFHMQVSTVTNQVEIEVKTATPVVDVERGSQASTLGQQYINGLPIDRRDYLSFALLMPGVTQTLSIVDDRDLRPTSTPQSGLGFYGSNGRGNNITMDGGIFTGYSQYVMTNVSQDAVQEFQINRAGYSAVLGGASGASINIVTKSGTNGFHGTAYGFFRNSALDARDPFAFSPALAPGQPFSLTAQGQPVKNSLSRQQFGGTAGFPIKKDKTFMFVAYEGLLENRQAAIPIFTNSNIFAPQSNQQAIINGLSALGATPVPCRTGQPAMPAANCAALLQNVLTINPAANPLEQYLVNQFETNGGVAPFPITQHQGSVRLDHQFNDLNQVSLRYVAAHVLESDPSTRSFFSAYSNREWTSSLQATWLHTFSANLVNEARAQWNMNRFDVTPNSLGETNLNLSGFASFGQSLTLPNLSLERDYEFADNLTQVYKQHTFQMGGGEILRGNNNDSFSLLGGGFIFGQLPGGILSPCLQVPAACGLTAAPVSLNALQSFGLGLPQAYVQGFGNPTVKMMLPWTSGYFQDSWNARPDLHIQLGVRYEIDQRRYINTTYHDVAPRLSVSWDPFHDHKTVVRAGYGIYYAPVLRDVEATAAIFNPPGNIRQETAFMVPLNGLPGNPAATAAAIFNSAWAQGKINCGSTAPTGCITPADLVPFGINVSNSGPLPPNAFNFGVDPNFQNPISLQGSFGIEREIAPDFSISANYIYVHTLHLPRHVDVNALPGAPIVSNVPGTNGLPFQYWGAPQCQVLVNNPCFVNPQLLNNAVFFSNAAALYQGGTLELKKRYSRHFTLMANYTYSKAMDDGQDYTSLAFNQVQLSQERSLSSFDQRHRVIVSGIIDSPFQSRALAGFQLSPVFQYDSARPFTLYSGNDVNMDHDAFSDRPPGAGRNTGIGPNYLTMDLRLSRRFRISEKANLQLTAEAFNLANRTNYATVNDVVGPTYAPPFKVHGSAQLSPSQPLGFTSDFPKREIQLGARFSF